MFERFTEKARRTIFFARYEAGTLGSPFIEPEHLLLGLLRECPVVRSLLKLHTADALRRKLQQGEHEKIPASVDLPLSDPGKRVLAFAAEEARGFGHAHIECGHLFAGILRLDAGPVRAFLREQSGDPDQLLERVRERLQNRPEQPDAPKGPVNRGPELVQDWLSETAKTSPNPESAAVHQNLWRILWNASEVMDCYTEEYGNARLHRRPWTRKQALGYLIDWASQYRLWLGRALTEPNLRGDRPPSEEALVAEQYETMTWQFVVESWFSANCLLLHAIAALPGTKSTLPCRIGIADPVPLEKLLAGFVEMTEDIIEQVLARLD